MRLHPPGLLALVAAALATGCASSAPERPMTQQGERMHFAQLDKTGDKYLTPDELPPDHELYLGFNQYDLNTDGRVSEYEFGEYLKTIPE